MNYDVIFNEEFESQLLAHPFMAIDDVKALTMQVLGLV